ncbi:MAG: hypothetical protein LBR36_01300 [Bacteroidales bacterium]|jgi:hypothetical protein|nr:hypothetical protein [Bacteroidales bacterium]
MEIVAEILKICIPSIVVGLTAWLTIESVHKKELKKQLLDYKRRSSEVITPIRLQAYERVALLLERIKPESLLLRNQTNMLTAAQYRNILLTSLRSEFDHNLSQQVYISTQLWEAVKKAKEETIQTIHLAAGQVGEQANSNDLASKIIQINASLKTQPSDYALSVLREEIKSIY